MPHDVSYRRARPGTIPRPRFVAHALCALFAASLMDGASALPMAATNSDFDLSISLVGGGPYLFDLNGDGVPESDAGNGISFLPNPAATVKAGALSLATAVGPGADHEVSSDPGFNIPGPQKSKNAADVKTAKEAGREALLGEDYSALMTRSAAGALVSARAPAVKAETADHVARVNANSIGITRQPKVAGGGPGIDFDPFVTFSVDQITSAQAKTPNPDFSDSDAHSIGSLEGVKLRNRFTAGSPPPPAFEPSLDLSWDFDDFELTAVPTWSKAFVRHKVEIEQTIGGVTTTDILGFKVVVEDGVLSVDTMEPPGLTPPNDKPLKDWFDFNLIKNGNTYRLDKDLGDTNVSIDVPLAAAFSAAPGAELELKITSRNSGFSIEAPAIANFDTGKKAGNAKDPGPGVQPNFVWDAGTGLITIDDIPIEVLVDGTHQGVDPAYVGDPVLGAVIRIDSLEFATTFDGIDTFTGGTVKITDGTTDYLTALLPMVFLDESLIAHHGFNLFGALQDIVVDNTAGSAWIDDYLDTVLGVGAVMPELFIGLGDTLAGLSGSNSFVGAASFSTYANVNVSFSRPAAEPASLVLLAFGWLTIGLLGRALGHRAPGLPVR